MEAGILEGISVHSGPTIPVPDTTWAEISLESGGTTVTNRSVLLAVGYVGGNQVLGWTGHIHLEPHTHVALRIRSTLLHQTFAGIKTRRA